MSDKEVLGTCQWRCGSFPSGGRRKRLHFDGQPHYLLPNCVNWRPLSPEAAPTEPDPTLGVCDLDSIGHSGRHEYSEACVSWDDGSYSFASAPPSNAQTFVGVVPGEAVPKEPELGSAEFEKWAAKEYAGRLPVGFDRNLDGLYIDHRQQELYEAWQAAREAMKESLDAIGAAREASPDAPAQSEAFAKDVAQELHDQYTISGKQPEGVYEWILGAIKAYCIEPRGVGGAEVRETREQKCECCGCPLGACIHDDCSECGGNFKASKYWQSRAETAELKVLTFHEEIVKLGQEWQSRVDQAESQVRELTALKDEIDQMRFAAECEVDQQDKEIAELTESRDKLKTEVMLNVAVQLREIGVTADVEGNFVNQESERLRSTVDRLEGELKEAQRQSQLGWADVKELQRILTFIASPENWYDDCGEWEWLPKKPNGGGMKSMSNPTLDELASLRARNSELVEGLKKLAAIWQEDSDERTRLGLLGDATLAECVLDLESLLATQKEKENVAPSKT